MTDWVMVALTALSVLVIPLSVLLALLWTKVYSLEHSKLDSPYFYELLREELKPLRESINELNRYLLQKK